MIIFDCFYITTLLGRTEAPTLKMTTEPRKINVAVIGGGFAGLALAIGLQHYEHINVNVYEGAQKFAEIGAGIVLGPNAQHAMDLIDPRIREGYYRRAAFNAEGTDEDGKYVWLSVRKGQSPSSGEKITSFRHEMQGSSIHRAHFLDEMVKLVQPSSAHFGKRVDRIYETGDPESPVVLHFKDGTSVEADVVLGCDGIHSPTRKCVLGPSDPAATATYVGARAYRAVVPMEKAREALEKDIRQAGEIYCGKDGIVIGYPLAGNTLYNLAVMCWDTDPWTHDEWIVEADVSKVKEFFKDWDPWVRKNVELLPEKNTMEWSIWDMPPARTFYRGKIAVVGDAAHATSPFQGSGASQAFEDACVLVHLLGKLLDPANPRRFPPTPATTIPVLLQTYDTIRRFRSQKVCFTSREMGRILSGNEPGLNLDPTELRGQLVDRVRWIYDYDQQQQVDDAFLLFDQLRSAAERSSQQHPA